VHDPERYGVVEFDPDFNVLSIEENQQSEIKLCGTGLYFMIIQWFPLLKILRLQPGEYEITDVNSITCVSKIESRVLDRGTAWLDTGTFESLMQAGQFVQVIEERQGMKIGCIEEVAYRMGFIDKAQLKKSSRTLVKVAMVVTY
jgi:glucose-1-phosphate thymidylyltransferase